MNPCKDFCYIRFGGKQYTRECDEYCDYAKVVLENKKLKDKLSKYENPKREVQLSYNIRDTEGNYITTIEIPKDINITLDDVIKSLEDTKKENTEKVIENTLKNASQVLIDNVNLPDDIIPKEIHRLAGK